MQTLIIAEAGVNHNGDPDLAHRLVDAAAAAGADYVKFQTFKADKTLTRAARKAAYQEKDRSGSGESQYDMLRRLELSKGMHYELIEHCRQQEIKFLSTAFDTESIDFLHSLDLPFFKIPSGEITNKPYLEHIAAKGRPVVMSTGMADIKEIGEALDVLTHAGLEREHITVLHCNTEYPTPMEDVNLRAMLNIRDTFGIKVGYSDHTRGIDVPIAAVSLGAEVIEKHFTLDRSLPGPDHAGSLEPDELKAMVQSIRNIEKALAGDGIKKPSPSELPNRVAARKSIHLARDIPSGTMLKKQHLAMKRPGSGISPMAYESVLGKKITRELKKDAILRWEDLEQ